MKKKLSVMLPRKKQSTEWNKGEKENEKRRI